MARDRLRSYPRTKGRSVPGEHALAALESFDLYGLAGCHPATVARGIREIRGLLAVARAAKNHSHAEIEPGPEPDGEARACPICRALARLRRASGGKP